MRSHGVHCNGTRMLGGGVERCSGTLPQSSTGLRFGHLASGQKPYSSWVPRSPLFPTLLHLGFLAKSPLSASIANDAQAIGGRDGAGPRHPHIGRSQVYDISSRAFHMPTFRCRMRFAQPGLFGKGHMTAISPATHDLLSLCELLCFGYGLPHGPAGWILWGVRFGGAPCERHVKAEGG